ncbi:MAG: hypothetical protein H7X95_06060 [Deltaproteobacteria bacterium]|nr:hypothetical protein [Deltaproteobacteria bacterium]
MIALMKKREFENHSSPERPGIPDCWTAAVTPACKPIQDAHNQAVKLAIIGYALGGALAAGSIVLFVLSSENERSQQSAAACLPDPFNAGIACRFRF